MRRCNSSNSLGRLSYLVEEAPLEASHDTHGIVNYSGPHTSVIETRRILLAEQTRPTSYQGEFYHHLDQLSHKLRPPLASGF